MNNSKKILKVGIYDEMLSNKYFTGIEYYLLNLSKHLLQDKNYNIKLVSQGSKYRGCFFLSNINNFLSLKKFNVIHAPTVSTLFFKPTGKKVVMTVHDLIPNLFPEWHPLKRRLYFQHFLKYRFRFVDRFIAVSENTKNDLINLFNIDSDNIDVVYEGVSKEFKPADEIDRENFILCVSTLEPRKNLKLLIKAYIRMKEKYKISEKLYIVGKEGWAFRDIYKIPEKYKGCLVFKGYVSTENLIEMYQKAKVFIYPSIYEGFGLPVLEAMACGCPVITSKSSSLTEVGGKAALYVNPNDAVELSEKIYTVVSNSTLQKNMSFMGLKQASKFTWKKCAENTIKVYKKALLSKGKVV